MAHLQQEIQSFMTGSYTLTQSDFHPQNRKKKDFKFLGMRLTQSDDFSVSISQDTKSIKELPVGVNSFSEEEKKSLLKSLVGQLLYLDLTRPDLAFMIPDLSCSSSKTSDERLRVVKVLLRRVKESAKSIIYTETNSST